MCWQFLHQQVVAFEIARGLRIPKQLGYLRCTIGRISCLTRLNLAFCRNIMHGRLSLPCLKDNNKVMRLNVARQTHVKGDKSIRDGCWSWKVVFRLYRIPTVIIYRNLCFWKCWFCGDKRDTSEFHSLSLSLALSRCLSLAWNQPMAPRFYYLVACTCPDECV